MLLPGSGSTPDFVNRAFAEICAAAAAGSRADEPVIVVGSESGDPLEMAAGIGTVAAGLAVQGSRLSTVCGVSIGAHAAAMWAADSQVGDCELVLVMPAWTDEPGTVGAATRAAAQRLRGHGIAEDLRRLRAQHRDDWIVDELERGWPTFTEHDLASAFERTGEAPGPGLDRLAEIRCRTAVVGLRDDPMHPLAVAREWAATIGRAVLTEVDRQAPMGDAGVLGRAALSALSESR